MLKEKKSLLDESFYLNLKPRNIDHYRAICTMTPLRLHKLISGGQYRYYFRFIHCTGLFMAVPWTLWQQNIECAMFGVKTELRSNLKNHCDS